MVASELMEAGRAVASGFVTPDRTTTIASTSRFYVMDEKIAMGDGRYDSGAAGESGEAVRNPAFSSILRRLHGAPAPSSIP